MFNFRGWSRPRNYFSSEIFPIYGTCNCITIFSINILMSHAVDELKWPLESSEESVGYISNIHDACSTLVVLLACVQVFPGCSFRLLAVHPSFLYTALFLYTARLEAENTLVLSSLEGLDLRLGRLGYKAATVSCTC